MLNGIVKLFTSLKLTVVLLGLAVILIFIGTLAQVDQGLYQAQARYFKSFLIYWTPRGTLWSIPVFPGGYLIGTVLLINLLAAPISRFKYTKKKFGILMIHAGIILLLLGQLLTDVLSKESAMRLAEGEAKNYSQDFRDNELVVIDTSDSKQDCVVSIPESLVAQKRDIRPAEMPFALRVVDLWVNSALFESPMRNAM